MRSCRAGSLLRVVWSALWAESSSQSHDFRPADPTPPTSAPATAANRPLRMPSDAAGSPAPGAPHARRDRAAHATPKPRADWWQNVVKASICPAPPARPIHLLLPAQHAAAPPDTCSRGTNAATVLFPPNTPALHAPTRPKTRATLESSPQGARRARPTRAMAAQATRPRPHHPPGAPPPQSRPCCVVECHATRSAARLLSSMRRSHLGRRSCAAGRPIPRAGSTAGAPEPHLPVTGSMGTRCCRARHGAGV